MDPMMQLVIGWTLVGGFVFTVIATCLSMVGVVKFANPKQQGLLFKALVLQLLVGVGGKVSGAWRFDAGGVGAEVHAEGKLEGGAEVGEALLESQASPEAVEASRAALIEAVGTLRLPEDSAANARRAGLVDELRVAPDREALSRTLHDVRATRIRMP